MASSRGAHCRSLTRKRRENLTVLPLYHHGNLREKSQGAKVFKGYFAELRGSTVFFYTDELHDTYCKRLELAGLSGMVLDSCSRRNPCTYTLTFPHETVHIQVDSSDAGEEWRGFIMTVATLQIPTQLQLLPGQKLRLEEVLDQERQRTGHSTILTPRIKGVPMSPSNVEPLCFYPVTRREAEQMLTDSPLYGNVILRPSAAESSSYALTVRHATSSGGPFLRHYKVRASGSGYILELNPAMTASDLNEVVDNFLNRTREPLRPHLRPLPPTPNDTHSECPSDSSPPPITLPAHQALSRASQSSSSHCLPPQPSPPFFRKT